MAVVVPQWTCLARFIIELFGYWLLRFWLNSELNRDSIHLPPVSLSFHIVLCGLDLQGKRPGANVERHREGPCSDHRLQGIPHRHHRAFCGQDDRREAAGGGGCQPPQGLQATEPPHLQLYGNGCTNEMLQRQRMKQVFWMFAIKSHVFRKSLTCLFSPFRFCSTMWAVWRSTSPCRIFSRTSSSWEWSTTCWERTGWPACSGQRALNWPTRPASSWRKSRAPWLLVSSLCYFV